MDGEKMIKETFFITHGCPKLTIEETHPLNSFFQNWREKVYSLKPKAILVISAHWITDQPAVNSVHLNDTMYDYEGVSYPAPLYQVFLNLPYFSISLIMFIVFYFLFSKEITRDTDVKTLYTC